MVRQDQRASISENGYFLRLLICLGALLALRIAAIYAAKIDLVLDEAQYWTWSRELSFGYFSKPPMIAWGIRAGGARGLRRRRGLHQGSFARTLHARLVDDLLVGPRAVRCARGFLVGHRLRDSPGRLVFLAPDDNRRPADPVLDHRALRLDHAGQAAKHGLCHPARRRGRSWPARQAGDDLRRALHRLPCRGIARGAPSA